MAKPEHEENLWRLAISPGTWIVHLLLSYVTVAIWCAKVAPNGALGGARITLLVYTLVALAIIAATGKDAHRRHRHGDATAPHDFDTPEDRHRFLGFATLLLSVVSAIGVIYVALPILFIETCR
jgi:hypothetical protein